MVFGFSACVIALSFDHASRPWLYIVFLKSILVVSFAVEYALQRGRPSVHYSLAALVTF